MSTPDVLGGGRVGRASQVFHAKIVLMAGGQGRARPMTEAAPERIMALGHRAAMLQPETEPGPVRLVLYRSGRREREVDTVQEAQRAIAEDDGLMAWVALAEPDREQLTQVARTFGVPDLVLEDALTAHQRPKAEIYHDVLFVVLRPAHYNDEAEQVVVGEVHLFASKNVVITIQHTDHIDLEAVRDRLETDRHILAQGPLGVVYAVLDRVVDAYAPVVAGVQEDIDELENQVFDGDPGASRRTYRLTREVILLQRAVDPLEELLGELVAPLEHPDRAEPGLPHLQGTQDEQAVMRAHLRDVADHEKTVREHVDGFRQMLQDIMSVSNTLVDQSQNEAMKKISSWGGILVLPALIASIFAMNATPGPDYHWVFSWPVTLLFMIVSALALYLIFRRNEWL